ncbi:MAG TPA: preprotein translocase subunit SecY [Phycisphaerae bacterium]|nr:preprotein translocase subunit SecY [Phycisphaerae bacterium]
MLAAFLNIFKVPELRNKILFTLGLLAVYRIGFYVPLPGIDQTELASHFDAMKTDGSGTEGASGVEQLTEYFSMFTGGNLQQSTIFGLGIMPYISASIIFQLLGTVIPSLEKLRQEGEIGRKKIQEYTRYATVIICIVQAGFWLNYIKQSGLVHDEFNDMAGNMVASLSFILIGITGMTAGTVFLMWLGEQIDEYGIGNGVSLIIMAGILARMPTAVYWVIENASIEVGSEAAMGPAKILFLAMAFVGVVAGSILITQGQRRIPIQQAKQMRGRRMYGGQRNYLPLRVNHGGVMPIIFASSLLIFPGLMFSWLSEMFPTSAVLAMVAEEFHGSSFLYALSYIALIYFFAYFWTTVQFQPKEMANSLRDNGSFIPGLRPGKRTADYLETVMTRITYVGAGFLALIAIIPQLLASAMEIPFTVSSFLGGTGLLIVVSVGLDLVQRIEANLIMRNYGGFLEGSGGGPIKGAYT